MAVVVLIRVEVLPVLEADGDEEVAEVDIVPLLGDGPGKALVEYRVEKSRSFEAPESRGSEPKFDETRLLCLVALTF